MIDNELIYVSIFVDFFTKLNPPDNATPRSPTRVPSPCSHDNRSVFRAHAFNTARYLKFFQYVEFFTKNSVFPSVLGPFLTFILGAEALVIESLAGMVSL